MKKIMTLVYLQRNDETLFLLRNQKTADELSTGKYIGVGGKVDPSDSSLESAAKREFLEETGFYCHNLIKKGIVEFIGQKDYPLETHVYICKDFSGEMVEDLREGSLRWIKNNKILQLKLWEGDLTFLPYLYKDTNFHLQFYYDSNKKLAYYKDLLADKNENPKGTIHTNTAIGFEHLKPEILRSQADELSAIFPSKFKLSKEVNVSSDLTHRHICIACNSGEDVQKATFGDRDTNGTSSVFLCLKCIKTLAIKAKVI